MASIKLLAGETSTHRTNGRHFRILSATQNEAVDVQIYNASGKQYYKGSLPVALGINFLDRGDFPTPFTEVRLSSSVEQTLDLWAELAHSDDDRLSGNFDINAALSVAQTAAKSTSYELVTISGGKADLLSKRASRKRAIIIPSGEIVLDTGYTTSSSFEWSAQQALSITGDNGITIDVFEDFD